jgi:hypothetical protein
VADSGLDPGSTYYYSAFALDSWFNYSDPLEAVGTTAGGITAVPPSSAVPERLHLYPARPNPFNPLTTIQFDLPAEGLVRLEIFDLSGRRVRVLLSETLGAGQYEEAWDSRNDAGQAVSSGVYFARLEALQKVKTTKLILLR